MATFRKRGATWQVQVRKAGHPPQSASFKTKQQAQAWAMEIEAAGEPAVGGRQTLADAIDRYLREVTPEKRGERWERIRLLKFKRELPFIGRAIGKVTSDDINSWYVSTALGPASVIRELNLLSSVFNHAHKVWKWIRVNPVKDVPRPKEPAPRTRRVAAGEEALICAALGYDGGPATTQSQRVAITFLLALETAMRAGELCGLEPERVHLKEKFVHLPETKNDDARDVPLSREAVRLFKLLPGYVPGISTGVLDALFRRARDAAKIEGLHFHDTRREALTRLAKKVDALELARISGHRDLKVLLRVYYRPSISDLAKKLG